MRIFYVFFILSVFILIGCKEDAIPPFDSGSTDRIVLVEEFTGVRCPNCPKGAEALKDLKNEFGDNLVVVALHTSFLGSPFPNSKFNFLTDEAEEIENQLGPRGKPNISINRRLFQDEESITLPLGSLWKTRIANSIEQSTSIRLNIENLYNQEERKLNTDIEIDSKTNINGFYKLSVFITESGIIDLQAENGTNPNYVHNHVFRKVLTKTLGDSLPNLLITDQPINRTFEFTFPNEEGWWIPENCSVVAFVSEYNLSTETIEVLQAAEASVLQ